MLYLPPSSWQFQKGFELPSQLFTRLGFFYVAVNYRGCDGYGSGYANQANPALAAQDILGILTNLAAADESFDLKNVFLWSQSSGGEIVNALTSTQPDAWRGAVLDHPSGFAQPADIQGGSPTPLLLISGDQDRYLPGLEKLAADAKKNGDDVNLLVQTNTGHLDWKVSDNIRTEREVLNFVFGHLN
jgi:dipeptidyl aminopeptidase/acylaminoacyl peptidase